MTRPFPSYLKVCGAILLFFIASIINIALPQSVITKKNAPKAIQKLIKKSDKALWKSQPEKAIKYLRKAIKKEPNFVDGYTQLASIFYNEKSYQKAISELEIARTIDPENSLILQALSVNHEKLKQYGPAEQYLAKFLAENNRLAEEQRKKFEHQLLHLRFRAEAVANPVEFDPVPISNTINTAQHSEYLPCITADGSTMYFTRVVKNQEDLYYSENIDGKWSTAIEVPNVNTYENEGAHTISADGKHILFTQCIDGRNGTVKGCNIYITNYENGTWSKPGYVEAINSNAWDAQPNISADGKTVYFSSTRKGGYGGSDIWYIQKKDNGTWSKPKNAGKNINTPGNEASPFLHSDGVTFYFMSDYHPGMGSSDLFRSELKDNVLSKPENLGYPINTEDHEGALVVSFDGTKAYFARGVETERVYNTQTDIYSFDLPKEQRANPVGYVKILVKDEAEKPLIANVDLQSAIAEDQDQDTYTTDNEGSLLVPLPLGKNFSLNINKEGYYFHSERFELSEEGNQDNAYEIVVTLKAIEKELPDEPIILKNVLFETASYDLKPESYFELDRLFTLLDENPKLKIELRGHTDDIGEPDDNLALSSNRAKSVYQYLSEKGIDPSRLSYVGLGETEPIDTNDTEEGRKNNRRTEFVIIKE